MKTLSEKIIFAILIAIISFNVSFAQSQLPGEPVLNGNCDPRYPDTDPDCGPEVPPPPGGPINDFEWVLWIGASLLVVYQLTIRVNHKKVTLRK